jgi:DNA-binding PadR family transcriptional regulator
LELTVLGLLADGPLHGYAIRQEASLLLERPLSDGALYPAIKRLIDSDAVLMQTDKSVSISAALSQTRQGAARNTAISVATPSLAGELHALRLRRQALDDAAKDSPTLRGRARARKTYEITPAGQLLLVQLLQRSADSDDQQFGIALHFSRHLSVDERTALLETRRLQLQQRLHQTRLRLKTTINSIDRYGRTRLEHAIEITQLQIALTQRLLDDEPRLSTNATQPTNSQLTER